MVLTNAEVREFLNRLDVLDLSLPFQLVEADYATNTVPPRYLERCVTKSDRFYGSPVYVLKPNGDTNGT